MFKRSLAVVSGLVLCLSPVAMAQVGDFEFEASIGDDGGLGSASYDNGEYYLEASGHDVWLTADGFYFIWNEVEGSFRITAEVEWGDMIFPEGPPTAGNEWKKAGVMARADDPVDPSARHVNAFVRTDYIAYIQNRPDFAGETFGSGEIGSGANYTNVVRLERLGNLMIGSRQRTDGSFDVMGSVDISDFPGALAVGLFLTAHDVNEIASVHIRNVVFEEIGVAASGVRGIEGDTILSANELVQVSLTVALDEGASADIVVSELAPDGFTVTDVSHDGEVSGNAITWNLDGAEGEIELAYTVQVPADHPGGEGRFSGVVITPDDEFGVGGVQGVVVFPEASADLGLFTVSEDIYANPDQLGADGTATYEAATEIYRVFGSGHDIWDGADSFHFLYTEVEAEESITIRARVQLDMGTSTDGWAKAGPMIRDEPLAESPHVFAMIRATGRDFAPQWRPDWGLGGAWEGDPSIVPGGTEEGQQDGYLELRWLVGENSPEFYYFDAATGERVLWRDELINEDGTPHELWMLPPYYVGLAVTAHQVGSISIGLFSDVEIFVDEDPTDPVSVSDWALF